MVAIFLCLLGCCVLFVHFMIPIIPKKRSDFPAVFLVSLVSLVWLTYVVYPVPPSFCSGWPCTSRILCGLALYLQLSARVGPVHPSFCAGRPCTSKVGLGLALYLHTCVRVGPVPGPVPPGLALWNIDALTLY